MKRFVFLILAILAAATLVGCKEDTPETPETYDVPDYASKPVTMPINMLIYLVNESWEYEDEDNKMFYLDDAKAYEMPEVEGTEERLYLFMFSNLEMGIFTDKETDFVRSIYVRVLSHENETVWQNMIYHTGAFLLALEPENCWDMIEAVMPTGDWDEDVENSSIGDEWTLDYTKYIMKIRPNY